MMKKQITIGIVAHVDAGKTTLSESILYASGKISEAGRVDHGDSHLDTDSIERERGITVFSSQAVFDTGSTSVTLLDTPGHADLSAETERVLYVLDYAVLILSAPEGVQSHTRTLWKLLCRYNIPTFIFINKMDIYSSDKDDIIMQLTDAFGDGFVSFSKDPDEETLEEVSLLDEAYMESFLENGTLSDGQIATLIKDRKLFPCYFGSALKGEGTEGLLSSLDRFTRGMEYPSDFKAKVFKITTDDKGQRLTHLKVTGGILSVRQELSGIIPDSNGADGEAEESEIWKQKISEIRQYNGDSYEPLKQAEAGEVVSVCGLSYTAPGMGLGAEKDCPSPVLAPVISYEMVFHGQEHMLAVFKKISVLEDEWPELNLKWNEASGKISVMLMGQVQTQVLAALLYERFGYVVEFDKGRITYRETIADTVEGVGHFEPLRHFAEVHLVLEPAERGSGLIFENRCVPDTLATNWQRLIMTHLKEKRHKGVLTGSYITDIKITLVAGKAHNKHTMGGDFRQATYRAVRQGLMKATGVILEPYYHFRMELPVQHIGRAMTDVSAMSGKCNPPEHEGDMTVVTGVAPVSEMYEYANTVTAYTAGEGRLTLSVAGYYPCHNAGEVIEQIAYDPEADLKNPVGSVFCSHGAGFVVPWDQVEDYMHLAGSLKDASYDESFDIPIASSGQTKSSRYNGTLEEDEELLKIFEREFGPVKRRRFTEKKEIKPPSGPDLWHSTEKYLKKAKEKERKKLAKRKRFLLVDGYNVIHSVERLKNLANDDLTAARNLLAEELCNYKGYTGYETILVFDAYKVSGGRERIERYNGIYIVYTREAETADAYIEKATHEIAKEHDVTVVTSDGMVQLIVLGAGGIRMSSRELFLEMKRVNEEGMNSLAQHNGRR